jgi:CheY-like chemotaxis protein
MLQPQKWTVLLVDDDADSRTIYGRVLTHAGYQVVSAANGHEALATAKTVRPEIVLLDLGLPDMDGLDVVAALRAHEPTVGVRVVILTAYVSDDDRSRARSAGCSTYLLKPVLPRHLLQVIEQCIDQGSGVTSTTSGLQRTAQRQRPLEPPRRPVPLSLLLRPR